MDYHRIYREFIADRKRREGDLSGYSEKHHILPRSLGGGDEPENLIRLTPEDHFFAHLVLAKLHQTAASWSAVMVMHERQTRKTVFFRKSRERYGWARRAYGRLCKTEMLGEGNPNYRSDLIYLKKAGAETIAKTRLGWFQSGIPHAALRGVMTGKSRSYHGWMLPDTDPRHTGRGGAGLAKRGKETFNWVHLDGREERSTAFDLAAKYGLRNNDLTSVIRGEHKMCFGWFIKERGSGWPSGRTHFRDEAVYHLVHVSGASATGKQPELRIACGLAQQDVSAIVTKDRQSALGWMLKSLADTGYRPKNWRRYAAPLDVAA